MFADRLKNIQSSGIRKVFDMVAQIKNPINLSIGTTDFDVPFPIKEEAKKWMDQGLNQYTTTQGIPELRNAALEHLRSQKILYDDVIITSGVTGGFMLASMVLINPGDELLIPDPRFVMYSFVISLMGGIPIFIDTYPDFHLREETIRPLITSRTKAILVNSPSNPTGMVYSQEELQMVARLASEFNLVVISDEIYEHFLYDRMLFNSIAQFYSNTIVLRGFSKSWGMSGWRIGYLAAPNDILQNMIKVQHYTYICVAPFIQKAALKALQFDGSHLIRKYQNKRDLIYDGLKNDYEVERPQGSFFIFPKAPDNDGKKFVERALQEKLLLVPGNTFSEKNTHFRISFAVRDETLYKGLEILQRLAR